MGEQSHPLLSGHIWSPIMRSSRGKFFTFLAILGTLCFILFLLSNTHSNLKHLEAVNEKCQQQRDSLSAQLQVVYEHKNRLEKSLQQEKTEHKRTKEDFQDSHSKQETELKVLKDKELLLEKQLSEIKSNYAELESERKHSEDSLKEQIESLQNQKEDDLKKLQTQINELITEKDKLEQEKTSFVWTNQHNQGELNFLRVENEQLKKKFEICSNQLKNSKNVNVENSSLSEKQRMELVSYAPEKREDGAAALSPKEKVLPRPHVQQNEENNNIEMENKAKDLKDAEKPAASEANEIKNISQVEAKNQLPLPMIKRPSKGINKLNSANPEDNEIKDTANVLKPPPFNDNLLLQEGMNQPAEKGEYANPLLPGQVEQPDFKDHRNYEHVAASNLKKFAIPAPNLNEQGAIDDAAQVHDMLNKSPGDTNDIRDGVLNMPPHDFQVPDDKMNLNPESALAKAHLDIPENNKHYPDEEDDDQEGDNDDDMGAGIGQALRQKPFRDFDDQIQEQNDNIGMKEVEGVAIAPK